MNQIEQNTFENQLGIGDYINIITMHIKKIVFLIFSYPSIYLSNIHNSSSL